MGRRFEFIILSSICVYYYFLNLFEILLFIYFLVKLVPVFDKLKKLQIGFTIEDDKVPSTEIIEEEIGDFEEVQSADVTSINKLS